MTDDSSTQDRLIYTVVPEGGSAVYASFSKSRAQSVADTSTCRERKAKVCTAVVEDVPGRIRRILSTLDPVDYALIAHYFDASH